MTQVLSNHKIFKNSNNQHNKYDPIFILIFKYSYTFIILSSHKI